MDTILIRDLEVYYRVGVPEAERAQPQRLLVSLEIGLDFTEAASRDDLRYTVDYYALTRRLLALGTGNSWALIETVACQIARLVLDEYEVRAVTVEVKKFIVPETRHVGVRVTRERAAREFSSATSRSSGSGGR